MVVVILLLVLQSLVVFLGLLQTLSIGLSEDIVGKDSLSKPSISRQRLTQLYIVLSSFVDN